MSAGNGHAPPLPGFPALARASRAMAAETRPAQALWTLVSCLREELQVDRAGVFAYDRDTNLLNLITGVDAGGGPEFGGLSYPVDHKDAPLRNVARRDIPYYFSNRIREEYPQFTWPGLMTAHAIVPIIAGDMLLGTLNVDNCLQGEPLSEELLEPMFLYAALAALPLLALYQQKERIRADELRRHTLGEMIHAVTNGKVTLCDRPQIDAEWPGLRDSVRINSVADVPPWRDLVRQTGLEAGMEPGRAKDLELCASEAVSNAIFHGEGGQAVVAARDDRVRVRVVDRGAGIDPELLPRWTLMAGASSKDSAGLGYTLIMDLADRVYLYTGPDGTTLVLEMAVEPQFTFPPGWEDLY